MLNKGDSTILFINNYFSDKEYKVLTNVYAYIDITQKKITRIDAFNIDSIEKTTSFDEYEYKILTNDPNIPTIQSSYENWGRGGKQNSKITLLNKDQKKVKEFLFPCFMNSSIYLLFSNKDYLIIESRNIYNENDRSTWLYVYKISDLISTNCTNYLSGSIDFEEKVPDAILSKFDPSLIGKAEF